MVKKIVLPSLSEEGWVEPSDKLADLLMANFLTTDFTQSTLYFNKIKSFGWLIGKLSQQPEALKEQLNITLREYFGNYFSGVLVEVTERTNPAKPSQVILGLYVEYTLPDGSTSNISKLAQINGSKFKLVNDVITKGAT